MKKHDYIQRMFPRMTSNLDFVREANCENKDVTVPVDELELLIECYCDAINDKDDIQSELDALNCVFDNSFFIKSFNFDVN